MIVDRDTIFALSSGRPPAAIAVIRISGPRARVALEVMVGRVPQPRQAAFARVRDPASGEVIDEGLALWFPGPKSETGEDIAELQIHGGRAVVAATLRALAGLEGFRHAEAGEFTRRAFEAGRMDLTAVEGLADLVAAETEAQRQQALRHMQGYLAKQADRWRERLIEARALLEAGIDFSDEGDVPAGLVRQALAIIRPVADEIHQADVGTGERIRDGLQVVIAGPPNVGKSTLLNRIAQRDVAIVSPHAGTTRDVIEVHLDLTGYPVVLRDTAGIRETANPIEWEGIRRARMSAAGADLVLWVLDVREVDQAQVSKIADEAAAAHQTVWFLINKVDLVDAAQRQKTESGFTIAAPSFQVSAETGEGVAELIGAMGQFAGSMLWGETALVTRERHRRMLRLAGSALTGALALGEQAGSHDDAHEAQGPGQGREELIAEEVRMATRALERLTGRVDVEDVLDVIFRDFCIGK